jgi:phosphomannomutase
MSAEGKTLSELLAPLRKYAASGEINIGVGDQKGAIEGIAEAFSEGEADRLDGLTVSYDDWWFNVRPSNTEPLLRLNVEADSPELMEAKRDELVALIEKFAKED